MASPFRRFARAVGFLALVARLRRLWGELPVGFRAWAWGLLMVPAAALWTWWRDLYSLDAPTAVLVAALAPCALVGILLTIRDAARNLRAPRTAIRVVKSFHSERGANIVRLRIENDGPDTHLVIRRRVVLPDGDTRGDGLAYWESGGNSISTGDVAVVTLGESYRNLLRVFTADGKLEEYSRNPEDSIGFEVEIQAEPSLPEPFRKRYLVKRSGGDDILCVADA